MLWLGIPQRMKLATSNLVCSLSLASLSVRRTWQNSGPKEHIGFPLVVSAVTQAMQRQASDIKLF